MRSQYFCRMFSTNNNFVESQAGIVKMPYSKAVLDKVIIYLYSGKMDCEDLALKPLMDLLHLLDLINLNSEFDIVVDFIFTNIRKGTFPLSDCLRSLDYSSELGLLPVVGETLLEVLGENFSKISQFEEVKLLSEAMIMAMLAEKIEDTSKTILR